MVHPPACLCSGTGALSSTRTQTMRVGRTEAAGSGSCGGSGYRRGAAHAAGIMSGSASGSIVAWWDWWPWIRWWIRSTCRWIYNMVAWPFDYIKSRTAFGCLNTSDRYLAPYFCLGWYWVKMNLNNPVGALFRGAIRDSWTPRKCIALARRHRRNWMR